MSQDVFLVFDITSSSVGAVIFSRQNNKPFIHWIDRISIPSEVKLSLDALEKKIYVSLTDLSKRAAQAAQGKNVVGITCIYGAPWHVSKQVAISIQRDTPFTVTEKFLDSVIKKEEEELIAYAKTQQLFSNGAHIADKVITNIRLNGYPVTEPYQSNIKHLSCSLFLTVLEDTFVHKAERIIQKVTHIRAINHSVTPLAAFAVLRDVMPNDKDFIAVLIGEEITEVFTSKKGELQNIISFPCGKHSLLRSMQQQGTDYHIALSMTNLHLNDHGEPEWGSSIKKQIQETREVWLSMFTDALKKLSVEAPLPKTIMFMSDETSRGLFAEYVKTKPQLTTGPGTTGEFVPIIFDQGALADLVGMQEGQKRDSILEAGVLYTDARSRNLVH